MFWLIVIPILVVVLIWTIIARSGYHSNDVRRWED